jgi:hypothetical protein
MNIRNKVEFHLEKVIGTDLQIAILYDLLKSRKNNISNIVVPTLKSHFKFVRNHPYRAWYLIKFNNVYIGSIYLMFTNCIGINFIDKHSLLPQVLNLILRKHKPLYEIKSIRPPNFFVNISPSNNKIKHQLTKIGAPKIQSTYLLEPFSCKS